MAFVFVFLCFLSPSELGACAMRRTGRRRRAARSGPASGSGAGRCSRCLLFNLFLLQIEESARFFFGDPPSLGYNTMPTISARIHIHDVDGVFWNTNASQRYIRLSPRAGKTLSKKELFGPTSRRESRRAEPFERSVDALHDVALRDASPATVVAQLWQRDATKREFIPHFFSFKK